MRRYLIWYWSATGGGGSQFAVNLARRLALQFGNEAVRLSLHANDPMLARARSYDFETLAANVTTDRRRPLATMAALTASADILKQHAHGADVVIASMNFAAAAPLSVLVRQPLVYVAHDPAPHPGDHARTWQRATQAILLQRCARVVAMSRFAQRELEGQGSAKKCVYAPLSSVFEPTVTASPPRSAPVQFLCAGRMMAYKGLDILADALPALGSRTDWRLIIAGDGPALDASMRAQLHHANVDLRPQWMSEAELSSLVAECDVLLAPYTSATQSGVVAQALAAGKPCIVTPVGALAEQIGNGQAGWVAAEADPGAFAAVMTAAIDDPNARVSKSTAALKRAQDEWSADYWSWLAAL
jgi:glycosyltransferase involved in cell wall biosynthesis